MGVFREAMQAEMQLRGFAARTQRSYTHWMRRLILEVRVPADQVSEQQVRDFLSRLSGRGLSASTVNQAISALRFFLGLTRFRGHPGKGVYGCSHGKAEASFIHP
jgi:site-specific recombinase XerD